MSTNKSVAKSTGVIGFATFCSRILGFARDIIIARLFGVYVYAQAFVIAFRIPNLFRDLVGEGAANAAFVPVFSEYTVRHTKEEFWELMNVVLNLLLVILMLITVAGIIFSPVLVRLIAPGFITDPYKLETTIRLSRIIFPYILLIGLASYATAILNSLRHFAVPAFAPCLLNISIITCALIYGEGIKGLSLGVLAGGLLQLAVQIPVVYKKGLHLKLFRRFQHPAAKQIGKLMLPRLLSSSIYQLNNFVDSIYGSLAVIVGEGGVAALYFSYRLIQFPIGIFSNALSQAILPTFSTQALEENHGNLKLTLTFGLRTIFFLMLPTAVTFMVLSRQIIQAFFEGGRFDVYASSLTSNALFFYSLGLFAYAATKVTQSCYFSLKDTVTPTKVSCLALALNIILNTILMFPLKLAGLALATSISGIISFIVLILLLEKKIGAFGLKGISFSFLRILIASLSMGVVLFLASRNMSFSGAMLPRLSKLGLVILSGAASYIIFCLLFGVSEMRELLAWLRRRK